MAVDFALFLSPDGIALAHRQSEGHWAFIGETTLDVPDLGRRLATLREAGETRAGPGFHTLLILPEEQIRYTEFLIDAQGGDLRAAVGRGLDGRTPYALGELAFDFRIVAPGRVQVAAVAQQTLTEAIDFARAHGFNGVGFAATPPEAYFPGVPIFELQEGLSTSDLPSSGIPFGRDTWADGVLPDILPELPEEPARTFDYEPPAVPEPTAAPPEPEEPMGFDAEFEPEPEPDAATDPEPEDWPPGATEEDAPDLDDLDFAAAAAAAAAAAQAEAAAATGDEAAEDPAPDADDGTRADEDEVAPDETGPDAEPTGASEEAAPESVPEEPGVAASADEEARAEPSPDDGSSQEAAPGLSGDAAPESGPEPAPDADIQPDEDTSAEATEPEAEPAPESPATTTARDDEPETDAATETLATEEPADEESAAPEPAPEPEPEAPEAPAVIDEEALTASVDIAADITDSDEQAASFVTDQAPLEPEAETAPASTPRFSTHRRRDADAPAIVEPVLRRTGRLGLSAPDLSEPPLSAEAEQEDRLRDEVEIEATTAPETNPVIDAAPEPGPEPEPAPEPEPEPEPKAEPAAKIRKRRLARTPALFAGGGQPHEESTAELEAVERRGDELAEVMPQREPEPDLPPGLVQRLRKRRVEARPVTDPEAEGATFAFRRAPELPTGARRIDVNDATITGGVLARRTDPSARPSLRTALVLTVVLILVLALIAVWSALFLPESRVAQWFGRVAPEVEVTAPAPEPDIDEGTALAPPGEALPGDTPLTDPGAAPEIAPAEEAPPTEIAAAEPEPLPEPEPEPAVVPRTPPPSPEEAAAEYEAYGIWQLAPDPPAEPTRDFVIPEPGETIQLAAIDPVIVGHDAVALVQPERPVNPRAQPSPPPFGTILNPEGLVAATPEGVLTPDGAFVVAGQPDLVATPRPGPDPEAEAEAQAPALTAAGGLTDAILAAFPPSPRPEDFTEQIERQRLGGLTSDELSTRRPVERPQSLQEIALAALEATGDSDLAVASSRVPLIRPDTIDAAVAAALARGPAGGASTASLAAPEQEPVAPPTVEPDIPSNASVSRSATVESAINLREINLIGVRGTPDNRVALVRLASGRFVEVSVGDRLDGGRVAAIGPDSLQYVRNGRNITLSAPSG